MSKNKYWLIGLGTLSFIAVITIGLLLLSPSRDKQSQKASAPAPAPAENGSGPVSKPQEPAAKPEAGTSAGSGSTPDNGVAGGPSKAGGASGSAGRSATEDNKAGAALPSGGKKPAAEQGGSVSSPEITPEYAGTFISDEQHRLEGKAIIYTKDGRKLVRLTDFKADAGAELHAILTKKGAKAAEGKDLGKIAANEPVQELEISASADFNQFNQLILYNPASKTEYGRASLDKF